MVEFSLWDIFRNLLFCGFNGPVYPINPKASHVMGVAAYPSLSDVTGPVDLAVLIVPAVAVMGVVDEAIAKKVKGLVVISAGFKPFLSAGTSTARPAPLSCMFTRRG